MILHLARKPTSGRTTFQGAGQKRQAEFAAGRRAARAALAQLGHPAMALPVGPHRAPIWPKGLVGAITHDEGCALAAVLPKAAALGLGIDLTEAAALPGETRREILPFAAEDGLNDLEARAGFSAKESLFKALFPVSETFFGFDAAVVVPDLAGGVFQIELTRALPPFAAGTVWTGHLAVCEGRVLTALVALPPR